MIKTYDFEHYLLAGHGRAYLMAVDDPEKYKDKEPFIQAAADSFLSPDTDTASHDIQHLSDFLEEMGRNDLIIRKYEDVIFISSYWPSDGISVCGQYIYADGFWCITGTYRHSHYASISSDICNS